LVEETEQEKRGVCMEGGGEGGEEGVEELQQGHSGLPMHALKGEGEKKR
jgi:hypothetical protein